MKRLFLPIVFLAFIQLASAQVSDQDVPRSARDQVIPDDLIVQGSECVGLDCVNNENFGFSTIILKENNLRIKFFDTSTGTFPSNDWTLEANSSANGGTNHFAIVDDNLGRVPFKIIAGAPTNSLFVASSGDLGIGTGNPVVEVHVADGDSPGLRLEQNGSSGFTPQTWDIAGNEANFFVRDVTGGSLLPFRIQPGAPSNSLYIKGDGNVGIGTQSPGAKLDIVGNLQIRGGTLAVGSEAGSSDARLEIGGSRSADGNAFFDLVGDQSLFPDFGTRLIRFSNGQTILTHRGTSLFRIRAAELANISFETNSIERMRINSNGQVDIIGSATVNGGMAVTSDRRLKSSIRPLEIGLKEVMLMNPVFYRYSGELNTLSDREYAGIVAQDLQEIVPEFVSSRGYKEYDENGNILTDNEYLQVHDTELKYILINAIKDQQKIIEDQQEQIKAQDERITDLEATVVELRNLIQDLKNTVEVNLSGEDLGYLGQNVPNPYQGETTITYVVPGKATSSVINIYDVSGKFVKTVSIKQTGKGQLKINANNLPGGVYSYQLVVDGKVIDSKKMVLQN